jgi:hypothetical protein
MGLNFRYTISALCYSIIHQHCQSAGSAWAFPHNDVVHFVLQQHSRMPDFLRFPIIVLTLAFDLWGIVQGGHLFHRSPHSTRWRQIHSWRESRIACCRDLIRFYESLTLFGWYAITTRSDVITPREDAWTQGGTDLQRTGNFGSLGGALGNQ